MNKIKVLHFTIANSGGGITKYALRIWEHINKDEFQCDFATMSKKLDFANELVSQGCKIHYISTYSEIDPVKFEAEIDKILDEGYDVLHLHTGWWRGFNIENIAKKKKVPKVIVHAHNTDIHIPIGMTRDEARQLHYSWQRRVTPDIATDFWACAKNAAKWLFGNNIPDELIKIIPNAIELDKFYYNEEIRVKYRKEMNISDNYVIGMIARFQYQKNHSFAIHFFEKLVCQVNNAILLLIGIGELENEIQNLIKEKNLVDKVVFLGLRADVAELLQAMDLFILPSKFDALAQTAVEAQATGLKCIVSDVFPEEAKITDNIQMLNLDEDLWVREAVKWSKGYQRFDTRKEMRDRGFDITEQIRVIEKLYSECEVCVGGINSPFKVIPIAGFGVCA